MAFGHGHPLVYIKSHVASVRPSVRRDVSPAFSGAESTSAFSVVEPALVFFFPPFSGGLPRVNTRVFFCFFVFLFFFLPPFSGGLPKIVSNRHGY